MSKENRIGHSRRSDKNQFQEIEDPSDRERMTKEGMSQGRRICARGKNFMVQLVSSFQNRMTRLPGKWFMHGLTFQNATFPPKELIR
jgi:hypothetical protein